VENYLFVSSVEQEVIQVGSHILEDQNSSGI